MDISNIISSAAALIFVLCLIGLTSLVLRKINEKSHVQPTGKNDKIKILEMKKLDAKNKLVLLENNKKEHLILLSSDGNLNLSNNSEKNIKK